MSEGFLGRWSRRKEAVREGQPVQPEPVVKAPPSPPPSPLKAEGVTALPAPLAADGGAEGDPSRAAPSMEEVASLTPDSDFSRFVRPGVAPEVKNAAFRKLFADPHFNVMDRLDTYIDDYGKPDPLPPEMLRQLASARFLGMFDDEEKSREEGREVADGAPPQTVAQSVPGEPAVTPPGDHADPDLRLQQDDAPGPAGPGEGPR